MELEGLFKRNGNMQKYSRIGMMWFGITGIVLVLAGCSAPPPADGDSTNDNAVNDNDGGGRPEPQINGFFGDDEVWFVSSDNLITLGYGGTAEAVIVVDDNEIVCLAQEPGASVNYIDGVFTLATQFSSPDTDRDCEILLEADASACASTAQEEPCDFTATSGVAKFGSSQAQWTDNTLWRLPACEEVPSDLADEAAWGFFNLHPFIVPYVLDPASFGGFVLVGGEFDTALAATVAFAADGSCLDESPAGDVDWDGRTLSIDLTLDADDNSSGVGGPGECLVSFNGTLTYCALFDPSVMTPGSTAQPGRLVRIDGTGSFTSPDGVTTMNTMYLLVSGDSSAGSLGGELSDGVRR